MFRKLLIATLVAAAVSTGAQAAVSISGTGTITYSQNFDSLASAPTATNVANNAWANDSTLAGWSLFNKTPAAITTYVAGNGSSNAGGFYSFGAAGSAERALGGLASSNAYFGSPTSGTLAGWIAVAFKNDTSSALNGFSVSFDGEQWRNGGTTSGTAAPAAQTMVLQYGFGNTFAGVSTWNTPGGPFDWSSPNITMAGTGAATDGNAIGYKVAGLGGTVSTTWNSGDTLWVRWVENNDVNNDHGLAIDNFSLSVTAVPEPESYAMMLAGVGLMGFVARRRSK